MCLCERQSVMTSLFPHEIVFPKLWFSTLPPSSNTTQSSVCFSVCSEPRLSDGILHSCCSHQKKKVKSHHSYSQGGCGSLFFTVTAGYRNSPTKGVTGNTMTSSMVGVMARVDCTVDQVACSIPKDLINRNSLRLERKGR